MINLFEECVEKSRQHHNFLALLNETESVARDYINRWTDGFIDRDGKMKIEFQTTFNSTFWELYLFNVFKKWNLTIDFSMSVPDFIITNPYNLFIEAVTANNAILDTPEWERDYSKKPEPDELDRIVYTATIRLSNALIKKYRKYKDEYFKIKKLIEKPFIIALAPFEQPYFWEQTHRAINQVLYGYKRTLYRNDEEKNERIILGHEYIDFVTKENGAEIQLGFFSEGLMPEISAIIFSNVATIGKVRALTKDIDTRKMIFMFSRYNANGLHPFQGAAMKEEYSEQLEDGLSILLNPYAKYPIDDEFINNFPNITFYDVESKCVMVEAKDGDLLNRMVSVFTPIEDTNET